MFKQAFIELRMTNNRYLHACQLNVGRNSDSLAYRSIAAERVAGVTFRHNRWSLTIRTSKEHLCPWCIPMLARFSGYREFVGNGNLAMRRAAQTVVVNTRMSAQFISPTSGLGDPPVFDVAVIERPVVVQRDQPVAVGELLARAVPPAPADGSIAAIRHAQVIPAVCQMNVSAQTEFDWALRG
jgi:hypothetical protein